MTKEEREKAINKIMGYLATYLSVEQYAEAERIIKELRQDTVSRESYEHEYFLRKELDFKIAKLEKAIEALKQEPCEDAVRRAEVLNILSRNYCSYSVAADGSCVPGNCREGIYDEIKALPSTMPVHKKCKWILYDYRTLVPREHGDIPNPYWRIPARYKTELKYCPYCGGEIDCSEVDAEIEKRGSEA